MLFDRQGKIIFCKDNCEETLIDVDYPGNDLNAGGYLGRAKGNMKTAEECRQACIDLPACVGFTFVKEEKIQPPFFCPPPPPPQKKHTLIRQSREKGSRSESQEYPGH